MPNRIRFAPSRPAEIRVSPGADQLAAKRERDRFYGQTRWRELRARHLAKNPLCVRCQAKGLTRAANVVHHVVDRLVDPKRSFDPTNLESLCSPCHTSEHKSKW